MKRDELLEHEDAAWTDLATAIDAVPSDRMGVEGVVPGWSIHDLVWHCAYWAGYGADLIERSDAESDDDGPEEAEILATGRTMPWDEVLLAMRQNRERARAALPAADDRSDAVVSLFREETLEHYLEHASEIRAFIG
jgi:hypothetical protein